MTTETIGKYRIEKYDISDDRFGLRVYNLNAKKAYHQLKHHISFRSVSSRQDWITAFKMRVEDWEAEKIKRANERKSFVNPAQVGDILVSTWGYDQTNVDFYQVTAVKGKTVTIRELKQKSTGYTGNGMADHRLPLKDEFTNAEPMTKIVRKGYQSKYCVGTTYHTATPWDGKPEYNSWYA